MLRKLTFIFIVVVLILSTSAGPVLAQAPTNPTAQLKLVLDPYTSNLTATQPWDMLIATFNGQLYTAVFEGGIGPTMLRSADGRHWQKIGQSGLGYDSNYGDASSMIVFNNKIYMVLQAGGVVPTVIIRSSDGITWDTVYTANTTGSDNPDKLAVINDMLFLTSSGSIAHMMRSPTGNKGSWQLTDAALGTGVISSSVPTGFNGALYISTTDASGVHVWRTENGAHWTMVGQGVVDDPANKNDGNLVVFQGNLYFGTDNLQEWWSPSVGHLYRSSDGTHWKVVEPKGSGSIFPSSTVFDSLFVYQDQLLAFSFDPGIAPYGLENIYHSRSGNTGDWAKVAYRVANISDLSGLFTYRGQQVVFNNHLYIATFYCTNENSYCSEGLLEMVEH